MEVLDDIILIKFLNPDAKQLILDLQKLNVLSVLKNQEGVDSSTFEVPHWQKEIVRERLEYAKAHPNEMLSWEEIENELDA